VPAGESGFASFGNNAWSVAPELERYLDWLASHGVAFAVAPDLVRDPDHDGPLVVGAEPERRWSWPGLPPVVEHRDPAAGLAADHATDAVARLLARRRVVGDAWDIGVGTGVLAVVAALAGARSVLATDVDEPVLALARRTVAASGRTIDLRAGSLLAAVPADARADLVIANLPHKPVPDGWPLRIAQAGGEQGDAVHGAFVDQAAPRLAPGAVVTMFLHSLPTPRLLRRYVAHFDLTLHSWKRRYFQHGEYGRLQDLFLARSERGESLVLREGDRAFLVAGVWRAVRR